MEAYKKSIIEYDDVRSAVDYAREEGIEYGIKKGLKEGIEKERQTIALNCLKQGLSIEETCRLTGLSKQEILNLRKEI
ncbi:hypothetical protein [Massilibacteroides sp.]|uniref:hypothetical protein n=1 Tax=Massilibacteroides sp. TaxID=2034766 RepID=UPI002632708F|nr:hypothetical protein [Massilibacteroides sp.]MDD4514713.1 hypothetical protein [Massilibacteroides sp.]